MHNTAIKYILFLKNEGQRDFLTANTTGCFKHVVGTPVNTNKILTTGMNNNVS